MNETLQFTWVLLAVAAALSLAIASRSASYRAWLEAPLDVEDDLSSHAR